MTHNPLQVVAIERRVAPRPETRALGAETERSKEQRATRARLNRAWQARPANWRLSASIKDLLRVERSLNLVQRHIKLEGCRLVDLGCGSGEFSRALRDQGADVQALDASDEALKRFSEMDARHIKLTQDVLPLTRLPDNSFDLVIASEVLAELNARDYRLFFSELTRLIKVDGHVLCSSELDIRTIDPLGRFLDLIATEFEVVDWSPSHHFDFTRLRDLLRLPLDYAESSRDCEHRAKELARRPLITRLLYAANSRGPLAHFWSTAAPLWEKLLSLSLETRPVCVALEKFSRLVREDGALSQATFLLRRKPISVEKPRWQKKAGDYLKA